MRDRRYIKSRIEQNFTFSSFSLTYNQTRITFLSEHQFAKYTHRYFSRSVFQRFSTTTFSNVASRRLTSSDVVQLQLATVNNVFIVGDAAIDGQNKIFCVWQSLALSANEVFHMIRVKNVPGHDDSKTWSYQYAFDMLMDVLAPCLADIFSLT